MPGLSRHPGLLGAALEALDAGTSLAWRLRLRPTQSRSHVTKLRQSATISISPLPDISPASETYQMRMFETVSSTMLAIAAQALVVGVVITAF
jgi:hypothetical protein